MFHRDERHIRPVYESVDEWHWLWHSEQPRSSQESYRRVHLRCFLIKKENSVFGWFSEFPDLDDDTALKN